MNVNCKCPRVRCKRHGDCSECKAFHSNPEEVINFCKWAETTGFLEQESRRGLRAWLSNDRTPFDSDKWNPENRDITK